MGWEHKMWPLICPYSYIWAFWEPRPSLTPPNPLQGIQGYTSGDFIRGTPPEPSPKGIIPSGLSLELSFGFGRSTASLAGLRYPL